VSNTVSLHEEQSNCFAYPMWCYGQQEPLPDISCTQFISSYTCVDSVSAADSE